MFTLPLDGPLGSVNENAFQVIRGREELPDVTIPELERRFPLPRRGRWETDLNRNSRPLASRGDGATLPVALPQFHAPLREYGLQRCAESDPSDDPPLAVHFSAASGHYSVMVLLLLLLMGSLTVMKPHEQRRLDELIIERKTGKTRNKGRDVLSVSSSSPCFFSRGMLEWDKKKRENQKEKRWCGLKMGKGRKERKVGKWKGFSINVGELENVFSPPKVQINASAGKGRGFFQAQSDWRNRENPRKVCDISLWAWFGN